MRIDRNEQIAGLNILRVRDAIRRQGRFAFDARDLVHALKVPHGKAMEVMQELQARGWIELEDGRPDLFQTTMRGNAFAGALAMKPIPRAKADKLLAEFMKRVEEVNNRDELVYYVHEVWAFGSYVGESAEVGDLDLAVDLRYREIEGRDYIEFNAERARASGRRFGNYSELLSYGDTEVRRILKARNPRISLHPMSDIKASGSPSCLLFRTDKGEIS